MRMDIAEAAKDRDIERVRHILSHSGDDLKKLIESTDGEYQGTALYWMTVNGELDMVRKLLSSQADVNTSNEYRHTPLHAAADMGFLNISKLLLKHGARTDVINENGQTPLHLAAYRGHYDVVECLLNAGADHTIQNSRCFTPLQESIAMNHQQVASLFCKDDCSIEHLTTPTKVYLTRTRSLSPRALNNNNKSLSLSPTEGHGYQSKRQKSQEMLHSTSDQRRLSPKPVVYQHKPTHRTTTIPGALKVCQPSENDECSLPVPAVRRLK